METKRSREALSDLLPAREPLPEPLSDGELDALDASWKPMGLLAAVLIGSPLNVARYLEWRDLWNARRAISYYEGDVYDGLDDEM